MEGMETQKKRSEISYFWIFMSDLVFFWNFFNNSLKLRRLKDFIDTVSSKLILIMFTFIVRLTQYSIMSSLR